MDHHCPWINNCVGFRNRKYFILFLFYITIGLIFAGIIQTIILISAIQKAIEIKKTDIHFALKIILTLSTFALSFTLLSFTLFHIKMVLDNTTTLEGMIKKKNSPEG
jgi:type III secretory pathway component EscS